MKLVRVASMMSPRVAVSAKPLYLQPHREFVTTSDVNL